MATRSANRPVPAVETETIFRIEPTLVDEVPGKLNDVVAELAAASSKLGASLHPTTAASLADLVRIMNTYYSNLIEGHNTRPRDIVRALAGDFARDQERRNLQLEAAAHVRVQREIDRKGALGELGEPAAAEFIRELHREFYRDAPEAMLRIHEDGRSSLMLPGEWRSRPEEDNVVGRHVPPASARIPEFMAHFGERYSLGKMRQGARILAIPASHHRFNYIHPFPDGNGRVSRLMSHAMGYSAGIAAHGLWSISRGLARGLKSRGEYKTMMDRADAPREGDLDGRGNLSRAALIEFTRWFLEHTVRDLGRVRMVEPRIVLEVAFDKIMQSDRHTSGFALRFPRILRVREDKPPEEINTVDDVRALYRRTTDPGGKEQGSGA